MTSISSVLKAAIATLMGSSGSPRLDTELILSHVLEKPREYLIAHGEVELTEQERSTFDKLIKLRKSGMPVPYILGRRGFFDRDFKVTSHVLIPRPETEHLVEAALEWAEGRANLRIVDVGTGSGVIALSLAARLLEARVLATDYSAAALLVARENGEGLRNVSYVQADLLAGIAGTFDIIAANLPYIAIEDLSVLDVAKFEPHVALNGGADGLVLIRRLLTQAPARLATPGLLLLEIGADQGEAAAQLARAAFPNAAVAVLKDYAGLDRVVRVQLEN
ncbi:MAG: peptide chain release factor N(5)-glutamine methyltransferase [Anaerolineae bacterium]|nr:peptide chain release factor N(5)-glutamine methyltransferase [Anaerolineae bacterium]